MFELADIHRHLIIWKRVNWSHPTTLGSILFAKGWRAREPGKERFNDKTEAIKKNLYIDIFLFHEWFIGTSYMNKVVEFFSYMNTIFVDVWLGARF